MLNAAGVAVRLPRTSSEAGGRFLQEAVAHLRSHFKLCRALRHPSSFSVSGPTPTTPLLQQAPAFFAGFAADAGEQARRLGGFEKKLQTTVTSSSCWCDKHRFGMRELALAAQQAIVSQQRVAISGFGVRDFVIWGSICLCSLVSCVQQDLTGVEALRE